jgi:hypothetical protein
MISNFKDEFFRYETRLGGAFYLGDLVQRITMEESLDELALRANFQVVVSGDSFPAIGPGQTIEILDALQNNLVKFDGIIHETDSENRGLKDLDIKAYCRAKYLESEDEISLGADMTASERFQLYANKWGIPLGSVASTGQPLDKAIYRPRSLAAMIEADITETAKKNGRMFRVRSNGRQLDLVELGTNPDITVLVPEVNVEKVRQRRTLLDKDTKVKYVGKQRGGTRKPIYGSATGETDEYGTRYRIQVDDRINTLPQANAASARQIIPIEEIITVNVSEEMIDSRAGDKVSLGMTDVTGQYVIGFNELLIINLQRQLGNQSTPGHCTLELGYPDYVLRRYYLGESVSSPSSST